MYAIFDEHRNEKIRHAIHLIFAHDGAYAACSDMRSSDSVRASRGNAWFDTAYESAAGEVGLGCSGQEPLRLRSPQMTTGVSPTESSLRARFGESGEPGFYVEELPAPIEETDRQLTRVQCCFLAPTLLMSAIDDCARDGAIAPLPKARSAACMAQRINQGLRYLDSNGSRPPAPVRIVTGWEHLIDVPVGALEQ